MIDNDTTDAQTVRMSVYMLAVNSTDQLSTGVVGQLYKSDYVSHSGAVFDGTSDGYTFGIYGGTFAGLEPGGLDAGDFMAAPNPCQTKTPEGGSPLAMHYIHGVLPERTGAAFRLLHRQLQHCLSRTRIWARCNNIICLLPIALNFGNVVMGSSTTLNLTVDNSSVIALSFNGPTLSSGVQSNAFQIVSSGCNTLPGGSASTLLPPNCPIQVRFTPTAVGSYSTLLTFTDSTGVTQQALVSGQGTYPAPLISPSELQFGSVQIGNTSPPQTVTVTLPNQDAAIANVVSSPSPYRLSQNTTCPRGTSVCQFTVVFDPSTTGQVNDSLLVTDMVTGYFSSIPRAELAVSQSFRSLLRL